MSPYGPTSACLTYRPSGSWCAPRGSLTRKGEWGRVEEGGVDGMVVKGERGMGKT